MKEKNMKTELNHCLSITMKRDIKIKINCKKHIRLHQIETKEIAQPTNTTTNARDKKIKKCVTFGRCHHRCPVVPLAPSVATIIEQKQCFHLKMGHSTSIPSFLL